MILEAARQNLLQEGPLLSGSDFLELTRVAAEALKNGDEDNG
jgi:hypothetical protein